MAVNFKHGKATYLQIIHTGASTWVMSSGLDDIGFDREADTAEVTTFGDNDRNFLPGLRGGSFSLSGHWASTYESRIGSMLGSTAVVTLKFGPQGSVASSPFRTANALLTSYTVSNPVDDKVSMSLNFQVTGAVTTGSF